MEGAEGPPKPTRSVRACGLKRDRFGSRGWCTEAQLALQAGPPPPPALSWEADWGRGWGLVLSTAAGQHAAPLLKTTEMALLSSPQEPLRQRPAKADSDQ